MSYAGQFNIMAVADRDARGVCVSARRPRRAGLIPGIPLSWTFAIYRSLIPEASRLSAGEEIVIEGSTNWARRRDENMYSDL